MKYFADIRVESRGQKRRFFRVLESPNGSVPEFNKRVLSETNQYKIFIAEVHAKVVDVVYSVYSTEEDVANNTQDDVFAQIIDDDLATYIAGGDFTMDVRSKVIRNNKKANFNLKIALIVGIPLVLGVGLYVGIKYGYQQLYDSLSAPKQADAPVNDDGLMIPIQEIEDPDAELITITIDRSWTAVQKEDIKLNGAVDKEGVAEITLPEFDREDFFSHVPGYTFGFSTDPEADRIEYYGGKTYKFREDTKLYRVLVKYGGGSGTMDDPYIINYYDQLELLAEEKARGYFKQTCDIDFPEWANHNSIDTVNELKADPEKEKFVYDGGGYAIRNLNSPLFGKVSGALITNVNIQDAKILNPAYKNYGLICCEVYNYQYEDQNKKKYETGETIIRNCSIARSELLLDYPDREEDQEVEVEVVTAYDVHAPEALEYDAQGHPVTTTAVPSEPPKPTIKADFAVGGITGIGGQIENCYVDDLYISCEINAYYLYAGGISGKPTNVYDSAVHDLKISGRVFSCGGIAGSAGGSKKLNAAGEELAVNYGGNIQGCAVVTADISSEVSAGGIAGEGASKAENVIISNCYSADLSLVSGAKTDGKLQNAGYTGGIIGTDSQDAHGHDIINTVSPSEYKCIGNSIKSKVDKSVRLAPPYAFHQETILSVLNLNSVSPSDPNVIYTGDFTVGIEMLGDDNNESTDETYAYPAKIADLFERTLNSESEE